MIFKRIILVEGKVIDRKTNKPVAATIHYENLSTGESVGIARANATTQSQIITQKKVEQKIAELNAI